MDIKMLSIDTIALSNRSKNALHRAGIHTVGEMVQHTEASLNQIRNLGDKSMKEILTKIEEYKTGTINQTICVSEKVGNTGSESSFSETREVLSEQQNIEDYDVWSKSEVGRAFVVSYLKKQEIKVDALQLLSTRAYNLLLLGGYTYLHEVIFLKEDTLLQIPRMDGHLCEEIMKLCRYYLYENKEMFVEAYKDVIKKENEKKEQTSMFYDFLSNPAYYDKILKYVEINNCMIEQMGFSNSAKNKLLKNNFDYLSEIVFKTRRELERIPALGVTSINEIMTKIQEYWEANEDRICAVCNGDESAYWDDTAIERLILSIYEEVQFGGVSLFKIKMYLEEVEGRVKNSLLQTQGALGDEDERFLCQLEIENFQVACVHEQVTNTDCEEPIYGITLERIEEILKKLIEKKELKYIDDRYYRIYQKFEEALFNCTEINERERGFMKMRLQGATLEKIAQEYGLTRERVRQVVAKAVNKVRNWYFVNTNKVWFEEDKYRYFFENYDFDKNDATKWLGIEPYVFCYFEMMNVKQGKRDIQETFNDQQNIEKEFRSKIKNYINRNKIYLDGIWIEKRRIDLEAFLVRKLCKQSTSFSEFVQRYNAFLESEGIPFDESIYCTDAVLATRRNRLMEARFLLWKQNEQIRYYDIDSRDYTELLDVLNLDAYENIEFSTLKFMEEYPEIMQKYDIQDQYELHNLLRKIVPEGSYNGFHCSKMPDIRFGTFDRTNAFLELLMENAPISINDFADLIHKEYGYDQAVIMSTYLKPLALFYHQGIYSIDQKQMSEANEKLLKSALVEDFYYIDEIKAIYKRLVVNADMEEINPYNLKKMGFLVLSRYVIQNYPSLEAYSEHILTCEDMVDITIYKKRFATMQMFSQTLMQLKRELKVIEFEPNQLITFRKLENAGITRELIQEFCDSVYDFVGTDTYFSIKSIRKAGFESELFDYGFTDWFYANLLISDKRFSFANMYKNLIFYKGMKDITIKSFENEIIQMFRSIDVYDLVSELTEVYGCTITDRLDVIYKVQGTEVFYDKILDRLYANIELYYQELDDMEGL